MAQRVTGINVRRRRAATKKQREEEARNEIRKLTGQLDVLRGRLTEVTEQREAMTLPNLEGKKVEHSKVLRIYFIVQIHLMYCRFQIYGMIILKTLDVDIFLRYT